MNTNEVIRDYLDDILKNGIVQDILHEGHSFTRGVISREFRLGIWCVTLRSCPWRWRDGGSRLDHKPGIYVYISRFGVGGELDIDNYYFTVSDPNCHEKVIGVINQFREKARTARI